MSVAVELQKLKRTGLLPFTVVCALLGAAVPLINMAVRSEVFLSQSGSPVDILLTANSQMMSMLNVLAVVIISCILYHIEFSGGAILKLRTLPTSEIKIYLSKLAVLTICVVFVLLLETAGLAACVKGYFSDCLSAPELLKSFLFSAVLLLPSFALMLAVSSLCENLWVSLGIGVIFVFTAIVLPHSGFVWSLFPFSLPFETIVSKDLTAILKYAAAAAAETVVFLCAEASVIKIEK